MGVSVIIPCRNQASTLERAVKSAFAAGANEVLVFDDASTDGTRELNEKLIKINNFYMYWDDHKAPFRVGVGYARNCLIAVAKHDWIIPLDADDELLRIPVCDAGFFAYGGWIEHYEDGQEAMFTAPPPAMLNRKPLCHATMMFSKDQWRSVGGYDPDFFFGEDYAFQCALVNTGFKASQQHFPMYRRYVGSNARTDKAVKYWPIIQEMAKEKYPAVFS